MRKFLHVLLAALIVCIPQYAFAQFSPMGSGCATCLQLSGGTLTGALLLPDGSAAAPSLAFASDADGSGTGIFRSAANSIGFTTNGVEKWLINSSGNLNPILANTYGIGTTLVPVKEIVLSAGAGTAYYQPAGVLQKFVSATGVGNGADTTNDPLWTLTPIAANTLVNNGDSIVLTLSVVAAANGNNKTIGITVGGTQVTGAWFGTNGTSHVVRQVITRVDATHVNVVTDGFGGGVSSMNLVVADLTANTLAIVVTGSSPVAGAANDIVLYSGTAEFKR